MLSWSRQRRGNKRLDHHPKLQVKEPLEEKVCLSESLQSWWDNEVWWSGCWSGAAAEAERLLNREGRRPHSSGFFAALQTQRDKLTALISLHLGNTTCQLLIHHQPKHISLIIWSLHCLLAQHYCMTTGLVLLSSLPLSHIKLTQAPVGTWQTSGQ